MLRFDGHSPGTEQLLLPNEITPMSHDGGGKHAKKKHLIKFIWENGHYLIILDLMTHKTHLIQLSKILIMQMYMFKDKYTFLY